jgi:hypothetical protein
MDRGAQHVVRRVWMNKQRDVLKTVLLRLRIPDNFHADARAGMNKVTG